MPALRTINLGGRLVGEGAPCYIIAEGGVNHDGDLGRAKELVDAAVAAGVDAVKFQAFRAEALATRAAGKFEYAKRATPVDESLWEMLKKLELSPEELTELRDWCRDRGGTMLVTPFDEVMVEFVAGLGVPAMKVSSTDNDNPLMLRRAAAAGVPVILSTGMCSLWEVSRAVDLLVEAGAREMAVLQCTTSYPTLSPEANLRVIPILSQALGLPVGYSDHTLGTHAAVAALALGACMIEKHFTLDRSLPGPDHQASLEPGELATLVKHVREVEAALGDGVKRVTVTEARNMPQVRRFVVAARCLRAGEVLTAQDICLKRAGEGVPAPHYDHVLGARVARDVGEDEPIHWQDLMSAQL
jgi:N,N'-diacetyllegionaminate synthase